MFLRGFPQQAFAKPITSRASNKVLPQAGSYIGLPCLPVLISRIDFVYYSIAIKNITQSCNEYTHIQTLFGGTVKHCCHRMFPAALPKGYHE